MDFDLADLDIEVDWPIIGRIKDDLYPYEGYDHLRYTARALCLNEKGFFGFLHIKGEDYFGPRDHLETCGGGLEEGETLDQTLIREVREELGYEAKDIPLWLHRECSPIKCPARARWWAWHHSDMGRK